MRPEILVSIAFCQLQICIWSYQSGDNARAGDSGSGYDQGDEHAHQHGQDQATFQGVQPQ